MNDTSHSGSQPPSGRFVVRVDPGLHAALRDGAKAEGVSLNDFCIAKLSAPGAVVTPATEAVTKAALMFGPGLMGIVAYGSWARDDQASGSDIDLLVTVAPDVAIVRELYRRWDQGGGLTWNGHVVEAHFVHLPRSGARITGLWAEAAVDGVVLFDRGLQIAQRLVEIRRRILAGEVVRRWVYGQPYWVEAA